MSVWHGKVKQDVVVLTSGRVLFFPVLLVCFSLFFVF